MKEFDDFIKVCRDKDFSIVLGYYDGEEFITAIGGHQDKMSHLFLLLQERILKEITSPSEANPSTASASQSEQEI